LFWGGHLQSGVRRSICSRVFHTS